MLFYHDGLVVLVMVCVLVEWYIELFDWVNTGM